MRGLGAGEWSRAYAFVLDGREAVIRFGDHVEDFRKDNVMAAHSCAALPIPAVIEIGAAGAGYFAVPPLVSSPAIPASCPPAPYQAPEPSDHGEQESQHSGQQERDPKRLVPMAAEVADFHALAVFQDEDQQQQQDDGK